MIFVCDECLEEYEGIPEEGDRGGFVCLNCLGFDPDDEEYDDDYYEDED